MKIVLLIVLLMMPFQSFAWDKKEYENFIEYSNAITSLYNRYDSTWDDPKIRVLWACNTASRMCGKGNGFFLIAYKLDSVDSGECEYKSVKVEINKTPGKERDPENVWRNTMKIVWTLSSSVCDIPAIFTQEIPE